MMLMVALTPKAREVIQSGREGLRPPPGELDRIEALLEARITHVAVSPAAKWSIRTGAWRFVPPVALGLALVGGAAFLALRRPTPVATSVVSTPKAPPIADPALPEPIVEALEPAPSAAPSAPKASLAPPVSAPHAQDSLAQEVALISTATSALRMGRAMDALKALDEHQRKFPSGVLSMERSAVRAQALCSLKRVSEGRSVLAHLAPQSPAAARAKQICDAAAGETDGR